MKKTKIRLYAAVIFTALASLSCLTTNENAALAIEGGQLAAILGNEVGEAIKNSKNKKEAAEQQKAEEEKRRAETAEKQQIAEEQKKAKTAERQKIAEEQRQREEAEKQKLEIAQTFLAAIDAKDGTTVQRLIQEGFDAKHYLANTYDISHVRFLLGVGVNTGWGELLDAAVLNDIKKIRQAVQNGADMDKWGSLALAQVIANRNPEAVKFLLDEGVPVSAKCEDIAIGNDSADILRLLIKNGGLEASTDRLCTALAAGKAKSATVLIEEGAPIEEGHLEYYHAGTYGSGGGKGDDYYYEYVKQRYEAVYPGFILYTQDPFIEEENKLSWSLKKTNKKTSPLEEAIPNSDLVILLLKNGAMNYWSNWNDNWTKMYPEYKNSRSPLHIAIRKDKNADIIPVLLKHGADSPNKEIYTSTWWNTPEKYAAPYFSAISSESHSSYGDSYMVPLIYAVYKENPKAVSILLKQKYPTELLTGALLVATDTNNTEIVQILIKAGATVTSDIQTAAKTTEMRKLLRSAAKQ